MTKVKVKGSFLSKPLERARPAAEPFDDDDDDAEQDVEDRFAGKSSYMPFVQANNKGKRGPRGAGRYPQKDSSGFQSSDSALGTSSGDDNDDDVGESVQDHADRHGSGGFGYEENSAVDLARRGSVRVKVKPSKFRENPSQSHETPEGRSPVKKRPASTPLESSSSRHPFSAKDYMYADRQQQHLTNELTTALMVVRKIMKMEAAEPFNIPVDPIALGIPDYFDIVKRPMDLGTICKNLERGGKYRSSRDVYEDVQLVWTNCRIYNQKGDPILELLSRVKKNFMKYWTAAGLYTEKSPATFKFQGQSPEIQSGGVSHKQREMQEDFDYGRSKKVAKYLKEEESPANSMAKLNSFEQSMTGSKAAKPYPEDFVPGYRRDQEVASSAVRDDLDSFYSDREGPKIISVYKAHKKKKIEQPDNEQPMDSGPKGYVHEGEQKSVGRGLVVVKHPHAEKSSRQKEADLHGTPMKSRRVSGTGHHKADCSCVVCTGVRRKLAREGKLGSPLAPSSTMSAESPSERILVRLKTEGSSDRRKSSTGAKEGRENYRTKDSTGERANLTSSGLLDRVKHDDSDNNDLDAEREKAMDRDGAFNAGDNTKGTGTDGNKGSSESDAMLESGKALSEEGLKGAGDEIEDKEDALLNDEQLADMLDAETERQEGGVRYYRASYEMPLRKMNPSILGMSQWLFGSGSPWTHGRSLVGRRPLSKACLENPIFLTVSALLSTKGT